MMKVKVCELCDQEATLYCPSDSAFLCFRCDAMVHQANFLVARHVRQFLCSSCKGFTCPSCSPEKFPDDDCDALSSPSDASACVSSTSVTEVSSKLSNIPARFSGAKVMKKNVQKARARAFSTRVDAKAEGSFVNWCRKLGLNGNCSTAVVTSASNALGFCLERWATGVPLRVCLGAAFWFGLRFCGYSSLSTSQNLRRVEEVSGVPAKLILAVEAKFARELRIRRVLRSSDDPKEGWAEC